MGMKLSSNPSWKGDAAQDITKRQRGIRLYPELGKCELCDSKATDRHHKDRNTGNNERSNVQFLCRRCHMTVDGRMRLFVEEAWISMKSLMRFR